jgi:hypothetical protein
MVLARGGVPLRVPQHSNPFSTLQARLSDRGMVGAESLRAGSQVYLVCDPSERILGTPMAENCQQFDQYTEEIAPSLNATFNQWL